MPVFRRLRLDAAHVNHDVAERHLSRVRVDVLFADFLRKHGGGLKLEHGERKHIRLAVYFAVIAVQLPYLLFIHKTQGYLGIEGAVLRRKAGIYHLLRNLLIGKLQTLFRLIADLKAHRLSPRSLPFPLPLASLRQALRRFFSALFSSYFS